MSRTVRDGALMLSVMAGPDDRDRFSLPGADFSWTGAAEATPENLRGLRVAYSPDWGYAAVDPEVRRVVGEAVEVFQNDLGCAVEEAHPGFEDPYEAFWGLVALDTDLAGMRRVADELGEKMSPHLVEFLERDWKAEEPMPLRMMRRFPPYRETEEPRERRMAVVRLHAEGWNVKSIASYLKTARSTVYRVLRRWIEEGVEGLDDRPDAGGGVRKADLGAYAAVRRIQENPALGAFRVRAALAREGIHLSARTVGRILAVNRRIYGLEKPEGPAKEKKGMPFKAERRHQYWSSDVRHLDVVDEALVGSKAYAITVLDNHSRAVVASAVSPTQDLSAFLSVLHRAVEKHGPPETLVTDSGSVFRANRARAVYESLGIRKEEIERGGPWQSYLETAFNVQRRMADWHFAKAESWPELHRAYARWVEEYNAQYHAAHEKRPDGRRSPAEVLGAPREARLLPADLDKTFFAERFARVLDPSGYVVWRRWKVYGEEALSGREAALWLREKTLTVEHAGEPLSRYAVEFSAGTDKPRAVARPVLFGTALTLPQPRLFALSILGEGGWLKALRLEDYAARRSRPGSLQQALFPYHEAWG